MDKTNSDITIVQPNYDSVYSSVDTVNQQPIEYSVLNNDNNIVVIIVDDNNNQLINTESVHQPEPTYSNDSSTPNEHSNCIVIHGDIIKEKNKWWLIDTSNNDLYETGKLDKNGNRSGLSYVCLNGETREIHSYEEDERVGNYLCFCEGLMYEYDEEDNLLYEGEYRRTIWGNYIRSGKGKEYKNGKLYYDGEWENSVPNGLGVLFYDNGSVYMEGEWNNGYINKGNDFYHWQTRAIYQNKTIRFFILSIFIIGCFFILHFFIIFNVSCIVFILCGIVCVLLSIVQQFYGCCYCCLDYSLLVVLSLMFASSLRFIDGNTIIIIIDIVLYFYLIIAVVSVNILRCFQPVPYSDEVLTSSICSS